MGDSIIEHCCIKWAHAELNDGKKSKAWTVNGVFWTDCGTKIEVLTYAPNVYQPWNDRDEEEQLSI